MGEVISFARSKYEIIARRMVDEYENKGKEAAAVYLLGQSLGTEGMAEIKSFVADEYRKRGYTIREDNI